MPQRRTYTAEQRAHALELFQTVGTSAASRETGIPRGTIGRWASKLGVKSKRCYMMREAVETAKMDDAAKRAALRSRLLDEASDLLDRLHKPCQAYNFGGKDNTFAESKLEEPDFKGKKDLMTAAAIAIDKSLVLEKHDSDDKDDRAAVDAWLQMVRGE
jgi:hypothetical protein